MLDVAPTELLLVAVVAVVVIGPKDLPKAMRFVGHWVGRARGVARQFRQGFDDMVRESEYAEMEKKWAEENARIMREFPTADPAPALPAPAYDPPVEPFTEPVSAEPPPAAKPPAKRARKPAKPAADTDAPPAPKPARKPAAPRKPRAAKPAS